MKAVHIGFTGTSRRPLTMRQVQTLTASFRYLDNRARENGFYIVLHHGDAVHGDATAHRIAREFEYFTIEIHPPDNEKARAFCKLRAGEKLHPPKPYLARNHDIVGAVSTLYACPRRMHKPKSLRGEGTWTTIGYARQARVPVIKIRP